MNIAPETKTAIPGMGIVLEEKRKEAKTIAQENVDMSETLSGHGAPSNDAKNTEQNNQHIFQQIDENNNSYTSPFTDNSVPVPEQQKENKERYSSPFDELSR